MRLGGWVFFYNAHVYQPSYKIINYLMSYQLNTNKVKVSIENERMHLNVDLFTMKRLDEEISKLRTRLGLRENLSRSAVKVQSSSRKLTEHRKIIKTQILHNEVLKLHVEQYQSEGNNSEPKRSINFNQLPTSGNGLYKRHSYNKKEINDIYKKIFDKNTRKLIELDKNKDNVTTLPKSYVAKINPDIVKNKIKDIKSKIVFMKGVYDYAYPLIMIKKLKTQKKQNEELIKTYHTKIIKRHQTLLRPIEEKILLTSEFVDTKKLYTEIKDKPPKTLRFDPLLFIRTTRSKSTRLEN